METAAEELLSAIGAAGGGLRLKCVVSPVGLPEAARLREFGAGRPGGLVSSVPRGTVGTCEGGGRSSDCGGDDVPGRPVLGRLKGGGVLQVG